MYSNRPLSRKKSYDGSLGFPKNTQASVTVKVFRRAVADSPACLEKRTNLSFHFFTCAKDFCTVLYIIRVSNKYINSAVKNVKSLL